jgi:hypothetical protein
MIRPSLRRSRGLAAPWSCEDNDPPECLAQQPALLVITATGRDRPGPHHARNGFLPHLLAADPWLGVIVIAAIVLAGLMLTLIRTTGRILEDTPWYVRLALLAAAGFGISRLLSRNRHAVPPQDTWNP